MGSFSYSTGPALGSHQLFRSFWMGGYECADQQNSFGNRVDLLDITGHGQLLKADYELLQPFNIRTVREGIRWGHIEKIPYQYDWSTVASMLDTGKASGIQQVWDICHFGFPDDLSPLHPMFARRFAALCRAFVQFYRSRLPDEQLIITPINEVSFLSWLGGDARGTVPYCNNQGWEVKYGLMRAYIEGVVAMKEIDPSIKILTTEPLVSMVPALGAKKSVIRRAQEAHINQFQATDILTGKMCPELGGSPEYLDVLGLNYYYNNQWIVGSGDFLPWTNEPFDPRWRSLSSLLLDAYNRYQVPVALTETSHPKEDRPSWLRHITSECAALIDMDVPLLGVCLYPVIDRPDWDRMEPWHYAGLWDLEPAGEGQPPRRVLYEPYAQALVECQDMIGKAQLRQEERRNDTTASENTIGSFSGHPVYEIPRISKIV